MLFARKVTEEGCHQWHRRVGCQVGPDAAQIQQQIEEHPELRTRVRTEESDQDRLARVERIAHHAQVVADLQQDADRGDPHQLAAVASSDDRAEQPLTAADGAAGQQ